MHLRRARLRWRPRRRRRPAAGRSRRPRASAASRAAVAAVSAMTIATGSPTCARCPSARIGRVGCTASPVGFEAHGTPPSSPRSSCVKTRRRRAWPRRAAVSMRADARRARAASGRTRRAAMPGSTRSSTKRPWPVISAASSLRRTRLADAPGLVSSVAPCRPSPLRRRGLHGLDDVLVAGAAAEVALERRAGSRSSDGDGVPLQQVDRGHDHPGRAVAALQRVLLVEGALHRVQAAAVARQPLDRSCTLAARRPAPRARCTTSRRRRRACTVQAPQIDVSQPTCVPVSAEVLAQEVHEEQAAARRPASTPRPFTVRVIERSTFHLARYGTGWRCYTGLAASASGPRYLWHPTAWSSTSPADCMNAYTMVGPTNENPRRSRSFDSRSPSGEVERTSRA